ncbi:uncharacterized protein PG998_014513 [Apiospora kogelbergensis]|uniref:uncharacterized protein n=1 Tax=Apiospora kogelbergensis TaxID=1337665 RepID=UPI0031319A7F
MPYKVLAPRTAPRPVYESARPKLTRPPKIACDACRSRKTASSLGNHVALWNFLLEIPEEKIVQVLHDAQAAPDLQNFGATASPDFPTRTELDYDEFTARYEIVYPGFTPIELTAINPQPRFTSHTSKPDLSHLLLNFGAPMLSSPATLLQTRPDSTDPFIGLTATLADRLCPSRPLASAPTSRPATPPSYIDERLHRLQVDYWTSVPISDGFAATAISTYLEVDHPFHALFDANLFLDDLINRNITFCSPFLVTSLLSHACYTCSAIDLRMSAFGSAFFKEAEILYKAERMSGSLPDSSALALFSIVCALQCRNELAFETQQLSRQMGKRMKLFGVTDEESNLIHFHNMPPKMKIASAQTAWGLYNWLSLHAFFYEGKAIDYPPIIPVPGDEWRRETVSGLDWPKHSLPPWMGRAFPALCTLCVLAQEIAAVYFIDREKHPQVSLAFAESKYQKLLEWAATLGPGLLSMYLHTIILTIFRPFLQSPQRDQRLRFTSAESSPSAIYTASVTHMKDIVLQHHTHHHGKLFSTFVYAGYMQLCSAIAGTSDNTETQRHEQQLYFDVCMCFFQDATLQHAIATPIAQGLLHMALESGLILASEMRDVLRRLEERGKHHCSPLQTSGTSSSSYFSTVHQAHIIVDFELAVVDVRAARAHTLASKLEDIVLFDELTNMVTAHDEDANDDGKDGKAATRQE